MKELLEQLKTWKHDIDYDIKTGDNLLDVQNSTRQSTQLALAVGLLESLGINNNIPE